MEKIVVVGASLAGVHASAALRERGFEGELTLVSAETVLPYDRPPISKEFLLGAMVEDQLKLHPASWFDELGITIRLGLSATGLDARSQRVRLSDGSEVTYDGLVLATGSSARSLPAAHRVPKTAAPQKVYVLRTLEDARALRAELRPDRHLVIVGCGFIGLETASVARSLGLDVTVVSRSDAPLSPRLGPEVGEWYRQLHERNGVNLIQNAAVSMIEARPNGVFVTLASGTSIKADLLVAGVGSQPATSWLNNSGVDTSDGVLCTSALETSAPHVVAAGDIARWQNPTFGESMRVEHWSNAVEQGRHAAATLLGDRSPFTSVPYFWTDQHLTKMRFVGRAEGATEVRVESVSKNKLVASYGRNGVVTGALCVGAPRQLAQYRAAIQLRTPWHEATAAKLTAPSPLL